MAPREVDVGPTSGTNTLSSGVTCRQRHGGPALMQSSYNWNALEKYTEVKWKL